MPGAAEAMTNDNPTCTSKALRWKQLSTLDDQHRSRERHLQLAVSPQAAAHMPQAKLRCRPLCAPAPAKDIVEVAAWKAGVMSKLNDLRAGADHMWLTFTVTEGM